MYCIQRGPVIVVMLGGGTKRTQAADIAAARKLAAMLED
jgi:putative component of toxin-antitoxin plasmid stabilization module